ncbi:hypothetical protein [Rhodococcus sp. ACS1]|uniref:hypothetical protein n=1 Tax=Rhodococcus sp. ACS1 TaxID=2028570 RepID=UPI00211C333B|nr:hypothetical protein [Rhodococcus sp. ACS1]
MKSYDQALVDFAMQWSAYGGGDDYIFTEFGIPPATFYRRVLWLVDRRFATNLDLPARQHVRKHCLAKLASFRVPAATAEFQHDTVLENRPSPTSTPPSEIAVDAGVATSRRRTERRQPNSPAAAAPSTGVPTPTS